MSPLMWIFSVCKFSYCCVRLKGLTEPCGEKTVLEVSDLVCLKPVCTNVSYCLERTIIKAYHLSESKWAGIELTNDA